MLISEKFFSSVKKYILFTIVFLFPLFFLPYTQEYFLTNKMYLLGFGSVLLVLVSTFQLLVSKKMVWHKKRLDTPVVLFALSVAISVVLASPNKIEAVFNPNLGLVPTFSLTVLYFYLSRLTKHDWGTLAKVVVSSTLVVSVLAIVFFFVPFRNATLPFHLQFLKNPSFNTLGGQLDLLFYLGFAVVMGLALFVKENKEGKPSAFNTIGLSAAIIALLLSTFSLFRLIQQSNVGLDSLTLPPMRLSWYAAVETLKNPLTALFGVGVDNYASLFTQVKDLAYNQSLLWQVNSFAVGRSVFLQVFSEAGLLGFASFALIYILAAKELLKNKTMAHMPLIAGFVFVLVVSLLFPTSFIVFFLLFLTIAPVGESSVVEVDMKNLLPFYLISALVSFVVVAVATFFLFQTYRSEILYKTALDGVSKNNLQQLYDYQRQAIVLNPYFERYRISFSQTNLLIANNIASKAQTKDASGKQAQLTDQERQTVAQAIQAAISEAKAAVTLNPLKASNWENLAIIYRNVLNVAQGADVWTISSYQRAVILDPQNPIYRLNLGGVYYSLNNFDQAVQLFEQATSLKPDWPNAHYNLAWAAYQKGDYQRAASEMQSLITLLDPKKDKTDYDRAKKDLEEFKKKIPNAEASTSTESTKLKLPEQPATQVEPKIELPKTASPEAK